MLMARIYEVFPLVCPPGAPRCASWPSSRIPPRWAACLSTSARPPKRPCPHLRALPPPGRRTLTRPRPSTWRRLQQRLPSSSTRSSPG